MKVLRITNLFKHDKIKKVKAEQTYAKSKEEFLKLSKQEQEKAMLSEHLRMYANEELGRNLSQPKNPYQKYVHHSILTERAINRVLERMGYA